MFDRDFIQRVRDAVSLPDLIGRDHRVEPQGREYKCICPFHNDTKPSLGIYERHGEWRYKCFACGAGGDCFTYLMEYHKMSFVEAVRECADVAGIEVPTTPGRRQEGPDRRTMLDVMQAAQDFFVAALASPAGAEARATFVKRGYDEEAQRTLGLGFAPEGWENLVPHLMGRGIPLNLLREMGLAKVRQQGDGAYDAFRNRLMFPIRDAQGRVVAFGGRIVDPEDNPKYLNSPEHPLFFKGKLLYGFDVAAKPIENENLAIVCEGYTDALACHRFGFHHAVATLGTAMTSDHARLLERRTSRVLLLFDGDAAGFEPHAERLKSRSNKISMSRSVCCPKVKILMMSCEMVGLKHSGPNSTERWMLWSGCSVSLPRMKVPMEMPTDSGGPSVSCWSWPILASTACPPCVKTLCFAASDPSWRPNQTP